MSQSSQGTLRDDSVTSMINPNSPSSAVRKCLSCLFAYHWNPITIYAGEIEEKWYVEQRWYVCVNLCVYACVCVCIHTLLKWFCVMLGANSLYMKFENPWFPKRVLRYRKYHWGYSPCSEPEKKKNVLWIGTWSKVDVVFQDQEQWLSQVKGPTTKCHKSLMN